MITERRRRSRRLVHVGVQVRLGDKSHRGVLTDVSSCGGFVGLRRQPALGSTVRVEIGAAAVGGSPVALYGLVVRAVAAGRGQLPGVGLWWRAARAAKGASALELAEFIATFLDLDEADITWHEGMKAHVCMLGGEPAPRESGAFAPVDARTLASARVEVATAPGARACDRTAGGAASEIGGEIGGGIGGGIGDEDLLGAFRPAAVTAPPPAAASIAAARPGVATSPGALTPGTLTSPGARSPGTATSPGAPTPARPAPRAHATAGPLAPPRELGVERFEAGAPEIPVDRETKESSGLGRIGRRLWNATGRLLGRDGSPGLTGKDLVSPDGWFYHPEGDGPLQEANEGVVLRRGNARRAPPRVGRPRRRPPTPASGSSPVAGVAAARARSGRMPAGNSGELFDVDVPCSFLLGKRFEPGRLLRAGPKAVVIAIEGRELPAADQHLEVNLPVYDGTTYHTVTLGGAVRADPVRVDEQLCFMTWITGVNEWGEKGAWDRFRADEKLERPHPANEDSRPIRPPPGRKASA